MSTTIRVGVAGLGHWGPNLCRNFGKLGTLAAICDYSDSRLASISANHPDAACYQNFSDMLDDKSIDAVAIATPVVTHGQLAKAALDAGKHVFVEKPICLDVDAAEALQALARTSKLTLMVGHLLLYHPAFRKLKQSLTEGRLGELRYVYSNRASLGKIRREENALWSFAPHDISMILALMGELPERVVATGGSYLTPGIDDTTLTHMTFPDGKQGHVYVSWLHPYKDHRLIVVGVNAMAVFNDVLQGPDKLLLYPHDVRWTDDIPTVSRAAAEPIPYDDAEPLLEECKAFIHSVVTGDAPPSNAEESIRVLRVLFAAQESIRNGQAVTLE